MDSQSGSLKKVGIGRRDVDFERKRIANWFSSALNHDAMDSYFLNMYGVWTESECVQVPGVLRKTDSASHVSTKKFTCGSGILRLHLMAYLD